MVKSYTIGPPAPVGGSTIHISRRGKYSEIWEAIENTPSDTELPITWIDYGMAAKFANACKTRRSTKSGYGDFYYRQEDNVVIVRGRSTT